jgi:hypothetical protein
MSGRTGISVKGVAALLMVFLMLVALPVQAVEERDAPRVRLEQSGKDDLLRVWHEPEVVQPGTQWRGYIMFRPGHGVLDVQGFQVCDVGKSCFAPPTSLQRLNETTWMFDTATYIPPGTSEPVRYEAGQRLGVRFYILEPGPDGNTTLTVFPSNDGDPADAEAHYIAFDMPAPTRRDAGSPGIAWLLVLGLLAWRRK